MCGSPWRLAAEVRYPHRPGPAGRSRGARTAAVEPDTARAPAAAMNPVELLHNAARWYCTERFNHYMQAYSALAAARGERMTFRSGTWEYSDAAWDLFPRYRVLEAIRSDVEHYAPTDFNSVDELREMLEAAGETAQIDSADWEHPVAVRAMADERRKFIEYVRSAVPAELEAVPLLPYRRVLDEREHALLHAAFVQRWGK